MELLATVATTSAMTWLQKLDFVFNLYDFDESGEMTVDEMTLALKSTAIGLAKITNEEPPTEADVEVLSQDVREPSFLMFLSTHIISLSCPPRL